MNHKKVLIRLDEYCARDKYALRRIEGTATVDSMIRLIDVADLEANPREAKVGDITDEIQETLEKTAHLFPFKSKGLLIAAGRCVVLDRNRFELSFEDGEIQGILDGGHNLLAIAMFLLRRALGERAAKALRGVKRWDQVAEAWQSHRVEIDAIKAETNFLTPIEIIYPQDGPAGTDEFQDAILDVARARNNNAQLSEETKANKAGLYSCLKDSIDPTLAGGVEWKTNDGGRIKAREFIALSWVALARLGKDVLGETEFNPVSMYRNKGLCVTAFNSLMEKDDITTKTKGEIRELTHLGVKSAIAMMKDMPRLFDTIYAMFPEAYNEISPRFGGISSVFVYDPKKAAEKDPKYLKAPPRTKFYQHEVTYDFPDGFIMPLVWALGELMQNDSGLISWKVEPVGFLKKNLKQTMKVFYGMIQMASYDPQKIGKTAASYELVANDFRSRLR